MKKALTGVALVLTGLLSLAAVVPTAHAYPEIMFEADVSKTVVVEGERFTATSRASVECAWTHGFNGKEQRGAGTTYTSRQRAPQVKRETVIPVDFTCEYDVSGSAARETATRSIDVTVVPRGAAGSGAGAVADAGGAVDAGAVADAGAGAAADQAAALPNTGGPSQYILVGGLLLLVLGGLAAWAARRRAEGDEIRA